MILLTLTYCLCFVAFSSTDSLVLEARQPVMVLQSNTKVALKLKVVKSHGAPDVYSVDVPTGTSLVYALELLQKKNIGFT